MAKSIKQVADDLILRFDSLGINLSTNEKGRLREIGFVNINGLECTVPNLQGTNRFGINVNKEWFNSGLEDSSKPFIKRGGEKISIDVNLFPTTNKLFALHYLQLRQHALQLETERNKWFNQTRWGIVVNESNESFNWVNNTLEFPLHSIYSLKEFNKLQKNQSPFAEDINEPQRILTETYRILRDTKISRKVKELYGYRCQMCGDVIIFKNGLKYAEAHHIKPLGNPHSGPDVESNVICVCPNHHALLDYGGIELDLSQLKIPLQHEIHEEYIRYHNKSIFKR